MILKRKLILLFSVLSFIFLYISCTVGMGEEVDLESPVITVTSPETLSNVSKNITITGTCSDNKGVVNVQIVDKQTGHVYGYADINGEDWTCDVELEEGEVTLLCIANDAIGNQSTKSIRTLTLLVDETAPEGLSWYVDRGNNIQTPLMELSKLQSLDLDDFTNIDVPQNEEFTIYGRFYDAMSIDTITLKISEDGGTPFISKTVTASTIESGKSIYSPSFKFSNTELVNAKSSLSSGKHYLKLSYYSKDNHGNQTEHELSYIIWWPESDSPRIGQTQSVEEDGVKKLRVNIGSSIPIHFFDDDELAEVRYVLLPSSTTSSVTESSIKSNPGSISWAYTSGSYSCGKIETILTGKRDAPVQITAPNLPQQMNLFCYAKDKKGKANAKKIEVEITDASIPLLFIESPTENTIPSITGTDQNQFKISGYSLDTSGSSFVKIAYIPGAASEEKQERAKALLNGTQTPSAGEFVRNVTLSNGTKENGWTKQPFEFTFDLLSDFKDSTGKSTAKDTKFFEILLQDKDNNKVFKQFTINGDDTAPIINIISPAEDLSVYDYSDKNINDLVIKFKAVKSSGLGINTSSYQVKAIINESNQKIYTYNNGITIDSSGNAVITIPRSEVKNQWAVTNVQPVFEFSAADVLGNSAIARRTMVLSPLPQLQSISSSNMDGTYKRGDVITLQASFSEAVKVTGSPRIKLKFSETDSKPKYAVYQSGNRTDTLIFTYTVQENDVCEKLMCDVSNPIVLTNDARIETSTVGEGDAYLTTLTSDKALQATKALKLDGVLPKISNISITVPEVSENADGNYYVPANRQIQATVTTTENIFVKGSPVLKLFVGSTPLDFTFQSIDGDKAVFVHKVTTSSTNGTISKNYVQAFSSADCANITDEAGNSLSLANIGTGSLATVIDTVAPSSAPTFKNLTAGTYNTAKTLELINVEPGAKVWFSKDGGVSWNEYTETLPLQTGNWTLVARQEDKAGNMSYNSSHIAVTIKDTFPDVSGFVISKPDGNYPVGSTITFKLSFTEKVRAPVASAAMLTFKSKEKNSITRNVSVTPVTSTVGSSYLEFVYTVQNNDEIKGIQVDSITFNTAANNQVLDLYGNAPGTDTSSQISSYLTSTIGGNRENIVLDGVAPTIQTYLPANGTVSSRGNVVILTFSEKVNKESGSIVIRRKSTSTEPWRIPPVLTEEEFYAVYNELSNENRQILMKTDSLGFPVTYSKTGQPLGPYRKITHGLVNGAGPVPDTQTKFVLDFNIGISTGSGNLADGTTVTVASLRSAFEAANYHKQTVDVTSSAVSINNNVVTITFPENLVVGREWELLIDAGAFADETGNAFAGIVQNSSGLSPYSFWTDKVAKPVVRVDRYSHGWAAVEPTVTGSGDTVVYSGTRTIANWSTDYKANNCGASVAPSGYARVRIDCETPGAAITYGKIGSVTRTQTVGQNQTTFTKDDYTSIPDKTAAQISAITTGTSYTTGNFFVVGDGELNTSRRDYVKAVATKTGMTNSDPGYEGVFKTVVIYYFDRTNETDKYLLVEGGTAAAGMPSVSGFPLRDASADNCYNKNTYTTDLKKFYWQSYEIVSDWANLVRGGEGAYSKAYYSGSYGLLTYLNTPALN